MKRAVLALLIVASALLSGCATLGPGRDATAALIDRKDFQKAAQAAPEWVGAALQEITKLEAELAKAGK